MNAKLIKAGLCMMLIALILASLLYFLNPFQTAVERGQTARVGADIGAISTGLEDYKYRSGLFPSTSQGLDALTTKPAGDPVPEKWLQEMQRVPVDPWGNAYRYELPGKHNPTGFDLYSTGGPRSKIIGNW